MDTQGSRFQLCILCVVAVVSFIALRHFFHQGLVETPRPVVESVNNNSRSVAQDVSKKTCSYRRTYRMRRVDKTWDEKKLESYLRDSGLRNPIVQSLADEGRRGFKTATIAMDPGNSVNTPEFKIDDKFLGITTLYTPPPDDHQVELVEHLKLVSSANLGVQYHRHLWP